MQDRPDADELLDAVAEHLAGLVPGVQRSQRFGLLVAANVCAIVARELRAGEQHVLDEALRISALLQPGARAGEQPISDRDELRAAQAALARSIRAGDLDERFAEAAAILGESVAAKLAIDHPGYDRPVDAD